MIRSTVWLLPVACFLRSCQFDAACLTGKQIKAERYGLAGSPGSWLRSIRMLWGLAESTCTGTFAPPFRAGMENMGTNWRDATSYGGLPGTSTRSPIWHWYAGG